MPVDQLNKSVDHPAPEVSRLCRKPVDPLGMPVDQVGKAVDQLEKPLDVAVDESGAVYIADTGNNRVVKWLKDATDGIVVAGFSIAIRVR